MDRVVSLLLILAVALIGADRINLLGGITGFYVTPFLVLTPAVVAAEILRLRMRRQPLYVPRSAALYFLSATTLICVIGVSALLSEDPVLAGRRTILLILLVQGSLLLALAILNQPKPADVLVRGAYVALVLIAIFNVLQVYNWVTGNWNPSQSEAELVINLAPRTYGSWFPRLSGTSLDQGRSALLLVIYLYILGRFARPGRRRTAMMVLGAVCLIGTLARAAALCAFVVAIVYFLTERGRAIRPRYVWMGAGVAALVVLSLMLLPTLRDGTFAALAPLADRLTLREGSSQVHLRLIERGLIVATSSVHDSLLGIGYGNGLLVLEDFFPGNRYANFHSFYITMLAEAGVFALVLSLWVFFRPFLGKWGPFGPLLAGIAAFNVFYQSNTEPAFWLIIALSWFTLDGLAVARLTGAPVMATEAPATARRSAARGAPRISAAG